MTMVLSLTYQLDICAEDNGLFIGDLHSCARLVDPLLELHEYAHACGDDTLATVFARSEVEP